MNPTENLFAGNSVQLVLNFHIPQSPSHQEILIKLQSVIYPNSESELQLRENAMQATLRMIGRQSQAVVLDDSCCSFFGHKKNFCHTNRFTILGSEDWPFEFQRAKVCWDAFKNDEEADIVMTMDYFMDLSKVETVTWIENGEVRIPIDDVEFNFNIENIMEKENYPDLSILDDHEILEISNNSN